MQKSSVWDVMMMRAGAEGIFKGWRGGVVMEERGRVTDSTHHEYHQSMNHVSMYYCIDMIAQVIVSFMFV